MRTLVIGVDCEGKRLDVVLHETVGLSRSAVARWILDGRVRVNGKTVTRPGQRVHSPAQVEIDEPPAPESEIRADSTVSFQIVFEDAEVLVVDKPEEIVTHPGAGHSGGTLVHGLVAHLGAAIAGVGHPLRPGIVHRLDRGTSGLMVIAKTRAAYDHLTRQFVPPRTISRTYQALVAALPRRGPVIELPIGRHPVNRIKMAAGRGRRAITAWRLLEQYRYGALLELDLETGRTHQIRVHLHAVGAPILGDPLYGPASVPPQLRSAVLRRQALHACHLSFTHPASQERCEFHSPLPPDIAGLREILISY